LDGDAERWQGADHAPAPPPIEKLSDQFGDYVLPTEARA
jgi:hypothetical protein